MDGQLGDGSYGDDAESYVPVAVSGISAAVGISAGSAHTCAVLSDGTARCWGNVEALGDKGAWSTTPIAVLL